MLATYTFPEGALKRQLHKIGVRRAGHTLLLREGPGFQSGQHLHKAQTCSQPTPMYGTCVTCLVSLCVKPPKGVAAAVVVVVVGVEGAKRGCSGPAWGIWMTGSLIEHVILRRERSSWRRQKSARGWFSLSFFL